MCSNHKQTNKIINKLKGAAGSGSTPQLPVRVIRISFDADGRTVRNQPYNHGELEEGAVVTENHSRNELYYNSANNY
jgi:hypothetical protein